MSTIVHRAIPRKIGKFTRLSTSFTQGCVRIVRLEWRTRRTKDNDGNPIPFDARFEEVGFNSASRNGDPFADQVRRVAD